MMKSYDYFECMSLIELICLAIFLDFHTFYFYIIKAKTTDMQKGANNSTTIVDTKSDLIFCKSCIASFAAIWFFAVKKVVIVNLTMTAYWWKRFVAKIFFGLNQVTAFQIFSATAWLLLLMLEHYGLRHEK